MAIPDIESLMRPLLAFASDGKEHSLEEAREKLATELGLTKSDLNASSEKGVPVFKNRIAFAKVHLQGAGIFDSPNKSRIKISNRGREVLKNGPGKITFKYLQQFPEYLVAFRSKRGKQEEPEPSVTPDEEGQTSEAVDITRRSMFTWIPSYSELARKILPFQNRQVELIEIIKELKTKGLPVISTVDQDEQGAKTPLTVIDPFSFFACFNRPLKKENRLGILEHLKQKFELQSELPSDFDGIPVVDNRKAWFFPFARTRKSDDIPSLWALADAVTAGPPQTLDAKLFERCLQIEWVGPAKLTMGMFWLNPREYVAWDRNNRRLFERNGIKGDVEDLSSYLQLIKNVNTSLGTNYPQISFDARFGNGRTPIEPGKEQSALNLVLYGPPGTGKTYSVIERAVNVIDPDLDGDHAVLKHMFDALLDQGRIGFITFHQSYSYEDFVEGIRPVMGPKEGRDVPRYECRAGVFKRLAINALFDCLEAPEGYGPPGPAEEEKAEIVKKFLADGERSGYQMKPESEWNEYVLVIDEINRGNVSKIFGELITLIEPDKRLQNDNSLIVTLPYSGDRFGVPPNLHLLATMNTADKSIALVDVALRRRFDFEELAVEIERVCTGLSPEMLTVLLELNRRIVLRKDRDHQIGHAYFVDISDEPDFDDRFRKRIIPLLQEYFYNDWDGLRYVLGEKTAREGDGFIRKVSGSDDPEARTKWQWFFDAGTKLNCLQTLRTNYAKLNPHEE